MNPIGITEIYLPMVKIRRRVFRTLNPLTIIISAMIPPDGPTIALIKYGSDTKNPV